MGTSEIVVVGNVYDCIPGYPSQYNGVYIFKADRSRFNQDGFDWTSPPVDSGAPLSEDYNLIENNQPNPVVADLDNDNYQEIIYSSYDGRVHVYWLDKSEHGNWPYSLIDPSEGLIRFASEPVIADLDNNGYAEVIFGSWVQKGSYETGKLHILDYLGNPIHEVPLPAAYGSSNWNGVLAAPTLADIDSDPDLEVVLTSAHSGIIAYDLPGTSQARILWGTSRGNYLRNGSFMPGSLDNSAITVKPIIAAPGDRLTYSIFLRNSGEPLPSVTMTDTLSTQVSYAGDLWASSGEYHHADHFIYWQGPVSVSQPVTITFGVTISQQIDPGAVIINQVELDNGRGQVTQLQNSTFINGSINYLPIISRE